MRGQAQIEKNAEGCERMQRHAKIDERAGGFGGGADGDEAARLKRGPRVVCAHQGAADEEVA